MSEGGARPNGSFVTRRKLLTVDYLVCGTCALASSTISPLLMEACMPCFRTFLSFFVLNFVPFLFFYDLKLFFCTSMVLWRSNDVSGAPSLISVGEYCY